MDENYLSWENKVKSFFDCDALNFQITNRFGEQIKYINLDNAATTTPLAGVKQYVDHMLNAYGSVHRGAGQKSQISTQKYDQSRDIIRKFVGASPENYVIFAQNTTGAINQAASLWAKRPGKILVSDIEHSSNLLPWLTCNNVTQYRTAPDGTINLAKIEEILKENKEKPAEKRIKLVTITGASTITGYKPPIYEIAKLAHNYGAKIFADLCQLIQHECVEMLPDADPCHLDFVAFSGHKMYAPYGTGVLIGPKEFFDRDFPYQIGGGNLPYITKKLEIKRFYTERAHDPGTPNAMGAIAIAQAIEVLEKIGREKIAEYEHFLVDYTFQKLQNIPGVILYISGSSLAHVIPFDLEGFEGYLVAEILAQEYGIGLRSGAFCTYEYIRKLKNISDQKDQEIAQEVERGITCNIPTIIRASFAVYNTLADCDSFVEAISQITANGFKHYLSHYEKNEITGVWKLKENTFISIAKEQIDKSKIFSVACTE